MSECGCGHSSAGGPFSEGRELVEFVYNAHGGGLKDSPIPSGSIDTTCQGCGATFTLATFVDSCLLPYRMIEKALASYRNQVGRAAGALGNLA